MVENNLSLVVRLTHAFAKYSLFIFIPLDVTKKIAHFHGFFQFLISTGLSIVGSVMYDAFLPTFKFVPSKIMEFGLNAMLRFSMFITIFIKINNYIKREEFRSLIQKIIWCNNLVRRNI